MTHTCPNCGKPNPVATSVCGCGELLRAEATYVQPWETETVFGKRMPLAVKQSFARMIALALALAVLIGGWAVFRQRSAAPISDNVETGPASSSTAESDVSASNSTDDAFDLSPWAKPSNTQQRTAVVTNGERPNRTAVEKPQVLSTETDPLDAQLLETKPDPAAANKDKPAKPDPDCKPEVTLKRPDLPAQLPETKAEANTNGKTYILGPRGGCFFVTPAGSKKYVDHSMCPQSNTAAARQ